jgi:hypothetical protein
MMNWLKLVDMTSDTLQRGDLLKFSTNHPFEKQVIMMICELRLGERRFGLTTITGYKAAITPYVAFPNDCAPDNGALSKAWLVENWSTWVWPNGSIYEVLYRPAIQADDL